MDGQLIKAEIINMENQSDKVTCMFNPKEYTFSKQNSWRQEPKKGQNVGRLEFGGGVPASLKIQLLFDTYEDHPPISQAGDDVRRYTRALWDMMKVSEQRRNSSTGKGQPPRVKFQWGTVWSFEAVIESISQKFTLFLSDGTPVRATLDVSFKQIADEGQYPRQNPTSGGTPGDRFYTVREGETLAMIAFQEYGDAGIWRHLAETNDIDNPLRLQPGSMLVLAPLPME